MRSHQAVTAVVQVAGTSAVHCTMRLYYLGPSQVSTIEKRLALTNLLYSKQNFGRPQGPRFRKSMNLRHSTVVEFASNYRDAMICI